MSRKQCVYPLFKFSGLLFVPHSKSFISAKLKTVNDRSIPLVHPYIEIVNDECHHIKRYDEYPKLARIFNIARQYGEIMVEGMVLPEETYGEKAVSRGDSRTRLVTLRNLSWEQTEVDIKIDEEIGLSENIKYEVRILQNVERIIGKFRKGE